MKRGWSIALGIVAVVVVAIVVIVVWPAPDPLADAETVYLQLAGVEDEPGGNEAQAGLEIVLGDRDLTIVSDRAAADVALELEDIRVDLAEVEFSFTEGEFRGKARAECRITDLRTEKTYTMDLIVRVEGGDVSADLVGRKFWQFWK